MTYCATTLGEAWRFSGNDVLLHTLPIFHGHGLFISSNVALAAGARLIFHRQFDASAAMAAMHKATVFMGVPTYYHRLVADSGFNATVCTNVRLFTCGSAPLSADLHREFEAQTGHQIVERYGATETMILCANPIDGDRRPGSVGLPLPGVDLRIADKSDLPLPHGEIGMIEVRSPGLFSGYWKMPKQTSEEFSADGYFRTGDLGRVGADGYVSITGRSKDLIISGGYNVYPAEVEALINEHPTVRESAVIGVPHADFGEAVVAVIIPTNPTAAGSNGTHTVGERPFGQFQSSKRIVIVTELPRNDGKVQKPTSRFVGRDVCAETT
jgi:malonyl-CoA/methylmalonyl-CoA synthetase